MQQLVIHIPDLARALATSEAAIRTHISRKNWPRAIPAPIRLGHRWAWRSQDVESWLAGLADETQSAARRPPGRPKKEEQVGR